jgi:hypothetical protein
MLTIIGLSWLIVIAGIGLYAIHAAIVDHERWSEEQRREWLERWESLLED